MRDDSSDLNVPDVWAEAAEKEGITSFEYAVDQLRLNPAPSQEE
ncbi:hypothetical protein RYH80_18470 [Halobaculum sp. MBLA0147]